MVTFIAPPSLSSASNVGTHQHSHDHGAHSHSHDHDHHHAGPGQGGAVDYTPTGEDGLTERERYIKEHGHDHSGKFAERDLPDFSARNWEERGFTIGIGGPVGSGKTALTLALCKAFRDHYNIGRWSRFPFLSLECVGGCWAAESGERRSREGARERSAGEGEQVFAVLWTVVSCSSEFSFNAALAARLE
ncbi:hypothetical protein BCR35DRAFT_33866 [Leucosporidium creatinivorum]|uniref:CobW/HypB/UreG nucleotide-binding domain-containing protein n=1 Tax=Leucosporidium creatinivorum TaxID=106004 RepID=A0A1Y2CGU7_9BASI|nr:hypothetical protein BCR35DRAFT_33866 [Leucosporidium creatinivorum]